MHKAERLRWIIQHNIYIPSFNFTVILQQMILLS